MKVSFVLRILLKNGKWVLSRKRDNKIQIQDMFGNGKPDFVFYIKRTPFIILISEISFKLGNVVLIMFNKMLVIVLIFDFYSRYGSGF